MRVNQFFTDRALILRIVPGEATVDVDRVVSALAAALGRMLLEPDLRARLGAAAAHNVRRFARAGILAQWDALVAAATGARETTRPAGRTLDKTAASSTPIA